MQMENVWDLKNNKKEGTIVLKNKFFSFVPFDISLEDDEGLIDVEMLRVGKFDHPVHGELDITQKLFDSMVANFENNILKRDVSFDWNHNQKEASAWLKDLNVIDNILVGSMEFTQKGKDSIEKKEYGYFSVEFLDDYEDAETGDSFGATLTGGALTNRPFITDLKKIEFEDPETENKLFILEEKKMPGKDKKKKDVVREPVINDPKKGDITLEQLTEENKKLQDKLDETTKKLETQDDVEKKLEDITSLVMKMEETNKGLKEEVKTLQEGNAEKDKKTRSLEVENICDKLVTEKGHHPSVVAVAKEIMLADTSQKKVIKLSETIGEGDDEKTIEHELSISDGITKLLDAIPASQRANYEELTKLKKPDVDDEAEEKGRKASAKKHGIKLVSKAA